MKIKVQKQILESILISVQPFLEKKDDTQITSHILIESYEGRSVIRATDHEIGLQIETERFETIEGGSFTANGKKLLDIIRILRDEEIRLETEDSHLKVIQKRSKFKLPVFDPQAYPSFPVKDEKPKISLDSYSLIKNFKKISPAIDTNNPKHELNGALINIKREYTDIVGTDTKRLAIVKMENVSEKELALILPKKAIMEIQKLFLDKIEIYYDENTLIITNEDLFFYTRLINGKYPDYERIIPKSLKHEIELPKKEMIDAIRMITTISHEIRISIEPDRIVFDSLSTDVEAKTEIERVTNIEQSYQLTINSRHMLDFLSQSESESFILGINEATTPFMVKDGNFITIIMPIII